MIGDCCHWPNHYWPNRSLLCSSIIVLLRAYYLARSTYLDSMVASSLYPPPPTDSAGGFPFPVGLVGDSASTR